MEVRPGLTSLSVVEGCVRLCRWRVAGLRRRRTRQTYTASVRRQVGDRADTRRLGGQSMCFGLTRDLCADLIGRDILLVRRSMHRTTLGPPRPIRFNSFGHPLAWVGPRCDPGTRNQHARFLILAPSFFDACPAHAKLSTSVRVRRTPTSDPRPGLGYPCSPSAFDLYSRCTLV